MNVAQDLDKQTREENGLLRVWNWISGFLHNADLIPFIVGVSGYHIFQVLELHDKWWSSLLLAMFLDLLHYRTVDRAIKTKNVWWAVGAALTTAAVFLLQLIFYSQAGEDGSTLVEWKRVLFASIVPVGIIYMVWHHHENELVEADRTQKELAEAQEKIRELETEIKRAQTDAEQAQTAAKQAQAAARTAQAAADKAQEQLTAATSAAAEQQSKIEQLQDKIDELQLALDDTQELRTVWGRLNPKTQSAARASAGILTVQEAAAAASVSVDTIRRAQKQINGHIS